MSGRDYQLMTIIFYINNCFKWKRSRLIYWVIVGGRRILIQIIQQISLILKINQLSEEEKEGQRVGVKKTTPRPPQ